jgi:hypothetical protein
VGSEGWPAGLTDEELNGLEREARDAIELGAWVEPRLDQGGISRDPAEGETWGEERTVRAGLLYALLTMEALPSGRRPRALRLRQVRIRDQLDLEGASVACPLWLEDCFVQDAILLRDGRAAALSFRGCHLRKGLSAQRLETRGDLDLTRVAVEGELVLYGTHVGGQLFLDGATLDNAGRRALYADGLTVEGYMLCRKGFSAKGEVRLPGAHIHGQLDLSAASLANAGGVALNADGITVDSDMFCRYERPEDEGDDEEEEEEERFRFRATGEVRLLGAHIGGQLDFSGARLGNAAGYALLADRLTVEGDMFCRYERPDDEEDEEQDEKRFRATGEVSLRGAHIGRQLSLRGAILANVNLNGLALGRARDLADLAPALGLALDLEGLTTRELILQPKAMPLGKVDLTNAKVGSVADSETTWPAVLRLRGFVYDSLVAEPEIGVSARLQWLKRNESGYAPQTYDQLAAACRADGRDEDALRVLVAKQRRRHSTLNPAGRIWNSILRWTVGYGYRPYYALFWLVALWVLGWIVFSVAHPGDMTPTGAGGPQFYAVAYSLDTLLPIVDLGQQSHWTPGGAALVVSWLLIGLGWVLTTAVVAALTGLIKRE